MSKIKLILPLLSLILLAKPASATDSSPSTNRQQIRQEVRQEIKQNVQERVEERQELRQTKRSNVAENHANRLERRFNFYYQRFNNIITRIETRISNLKTGGKDTSLVETKLTTAKSNLAAAKTKGDEAIAAFRAIDPAKFAEQKDKAFAARDLANAARQLFLQVHKDLMAVMVELKKL